MKRFAVVLLATISLFSLFGCGEHKPSIEEVEQAIQEGDLTSEDAVEKGYVTQEWMDEYIQSHSVPAGNKMETGAIGDFVTTTITGQEFTKDQIGNVALFAFLDPTDPESQPFYEALKDGYNDVKDAGAEIVVCIKGDTAGEAFADAPFPVIFYNDSLKAATEAHREMIEDLQNSGSWYVDGSFLSAWFTTIEGQDLGDDAASFVEIEKNIANNISDNGSAAAVMG